MNDYAEKRDFLRMNIECPARFRIAGGKTVSAAVVKNLSSTGILLESDQSLEPGTQLAVEIMPGKTITPPLSAEACVIRSYPSDEGNFNIACNIERILEDHEVHADFP
ncbi:MAG: PilZ domain-containing protein [gamma proteobacterium endosymbiont of Lamellibrachia anaximandri]|nr:PilZ domain-containing protein [gamma proteobacterium endosymbiont of Lamellibrachia anaximandri]